MPFPIAVITDEITQDFREACDVADQCGANGVEIRMAYGKNVLELDLEQHESMVEEMRRHKLVCVGLSLPLNKWPLPGTELDPLFPADQFGAPYSQSKKRELWYRALKISDTLEADLWRVFAFLRTKNPDLYVQRIADEIGQLGMFAAVYGIRIGVETEHCTHVAQTFELVRLLSQVDLPNVGGVWDPGNTFVAGEIGQITALKKLKPNKNFHVHAKDRSRSENRWAQFGQGDLGWPRLLKALVEVGYAGWVSLEHHYPFPVPKTPEEWAAKTPATTEGLKTLVEMAETA